MSSYIVDDETINTILRAIRQVEDYNRVVGTLHEADDFFWAVKVCEDNEPDVWELWEGDMSRLGMEMRHLNARALDERYGDGTYGRDGYFPYMYQANPRTSDSPYQVLKSMRCFLYQCSEGDVPNEPLYKWIEKLAYALAYDIATSAPEYKNAEWR